MDIINRLLRGDCHKSPECIKTLHTLDIELNPADIKNMLTCGNIDNDGLIKIFSGEKNQVNILKEGNSRIILRILKWVENSISEYIDSKTFHPVTEGSDKLLEMEILIAGRNGVQLQTTVSFN